MRRVAAVVLLAVAGLFALAPVASAHALLRSSVPASGAQVDRAPDAVTVVFTEDPEPSLSVLHVLDASGTSFEQGRPQRVPGDRKALRVAVRGLSKGVFTVTWRVVSRVDGHATAGSFAFGVGVPVGAQPPPPAAVVSKSPPPSGLEMAGRLFLFLGLVGIIGGAWIALNAFRAPPPPVIRLAAWSSACAALGIGLLGWAQWSASSGAEVGFSVFLKSPLGRALIWRSAGLVAAAGGAIAASSTSGRLQRAKLWVAIAGAAVVAYAHVGAGHAGAASPRTAEILAQWVHVIAASVWVGGLAALLAGLRGAPDEDKAGAVRRFSTVAAFALAVVAATGVVRAFGQLHRWSDLWSSGYGVVVMVKIGLILVLVTLGAVNRYRNVPRADADLKPLRRVSRVEVVVGAVTLAAASVLASLAPPAPATSAPAATAGVVASGADFATTVRVRLVVTPGTAGPNRFEVRLTDYDSRRALTDAKITLRFRYLDDPRVGGSALELKPAGSVYRGEGLTLSLTGRWRVGVLIERGTDSIEVPLQIATTCVTRVIPGDPVIYVVTLASGTAQGYVDPGRAGFNEVHVTFFDVAGNELPVSALPTMRGSSGDRLLPLTARRLGAGHFVADAQLTAGVWRFDFSAEAGGSALRGCYSDTVRP
jgi:copper transport protein